jgi:hypothetical protein
VGFEATDRRTLLFYKIDLNRTWLDLILNENKDKINSNIWKEEINLKFLNLDIKLQSKCPNQRFNKQPMLYIKHL